MARWGTFEFYDPVGDETWVFTIGPEQGLSSDVSTVVSNELVNSAGRRVIYDAPEIVSPGPTLDYGEPFPEQFSLSGRFLTEEHYNDLVAWASIENELEFTDVFGRVYTVMLGTLSTTQEARRRNQWHGSWDMTLTVIDLLDGMV